jgi:hypothetical protein
MLHSLTCTSSPNMNTWSNCRSEFKINEMPSSNFYGCTSGFQKYAHVLNKPIGSCCLKYAGTRGRFYYSICSATTLYDRIVGPLHYKSHCLKIKKMQFLRLLHFKSFDFYPDRAFPRSDVLVIFSFRA